MNGFGFVVWGLGWTSARSNAGVEAGDWPNAAVDRKAIKLRPDARVIIQNLLRHERFKDYRLKPVDSYSD
jgi:hypothetical protein